MYDFDFLNFWSWIFVKTAKFWASFMQKFLQSPGSSAHGLFRILPSYWLVHFFKWKNRPKCCTILVWIAGCWNSSNNSPRAILKGTIVDSLIFGAGLAEKMAVETRLPKSRSIRWIFLKRFRTLKSFQISRLKYKKIKKNLQRLIFTRPQVKFSSFLLLFSLHLLDMTDEKINSLFELYLVFGWKGCPSKPSQ
jgi:hypothetical protein